MNESETPNSAVTTTSEVLAATEQEKRRKVMLASALLVMMAAIVAVLFALQSQLRGPVRPNQASLLALQTELTQMRSQLSAQRVSLGLPPLEPPQDSLEKIAANLRDNVTALVEQVERYASGEIAKELTQVKNELSLSQQQRETLEATIAQQTSEIQNLRTDNADTERLRREMIALAAERETLSKQLTEAQRALAGYEGSASADEIADLKRRLEETTRAKEFFEQQANASDGMLPLPPIAVTSTISDLPPEAQPLVKHLQALETEADVHLPDAYANLALELGASVSGGIVLTDGEELSPLDQELLKEVIANAGENDLLVVIGYAALSDQAADAQAEASHQVLPVAAHLAAHKQPAQQVVAYAFGATSRFAPTQANENRRSEIWRIKRP